VQFDAGARNNAVEQFDAGARINAAKQIDYYATSHRGLPSPRVRGEGQGEGRYAVENVSGASSRKYARGARLR
jgi:hypothetical protein